MTNAIMIWKALYLLAQGNALNELPVSRETPSPLLTPEIKIILGLTLAVAASLVFWAYFIRKRKPTDPHARVIEAGPIGSDPGSDSSHRHHRRRRGHRHRRRRSSSRSLQRNPTLQETGGLPPLRPEDEMPRI